MSGDFGKYILFLCVFFSMSVYAQNSDLIWEKKVDVGIEGMIACSFNDKTVAVDVGRPTLKFRCNNFKIGIGSFPSLVIMDSTAISRLGV